MPKIKDHPLANLVIQAVITIAIGVGGWYAKSTNDAIHDVQVEVANLRVAVARLEEKVK